MTRFQLPRTARVPAPFVSLAILAMTALPALAQAESDLRPPRITESPSSPKIWMYTLFILLLAGVVFAASLKSKRTHQD
jgi:hypothetical protein